MLTGVPFMMNEVAVVLLERKIAVQPANDRLDVILILDGIYESIAALLWLMLFVTLVNTQASSTKKYCKFVGN